MISGNINKVLGLSDRASYLGTIFNFREHPWAILDIIIVAVLFYWGYLFLKETRALRIIYGFFFLLGIFLLGRIFQLTALNVILKYAISTLIVAVPIVFQPELRAALEKLGRTRFIGDFTLMKKTEIDSFIIDLTQAVDYLAKNKIGALIVLGRATGLKEFIETGVPLHAQFSSRLLINIFTPNTPLHDGAVIIQGNRIVAANCTLPLAEVSSDFDLGTRHRAAMGLSGQTDAIVTIVSEEKGAISLSESGRLVRAIESGELRSKLLKLLHGTPK